MVRFIENDTSDEIEACDRELYKSKHLMLNNYHILSSNQSVQSLVIVLFSIQNSTIPGDTMISHCKKTWFD